MNNEFEDVMHKRTDADLIRILSSPSGDYQVAAVEAAQREFDKRNLSDQQLTDIKQTIVQKQQQDDAKANIPLSIGWKILTFILPAILQLMVAGTFKADVYDRKAKE